MHSEILNTSIEYLKGVGPKRAELLKSEVEIYTYRDLLLYFPFRYVDRSSTLLIKNIRSEMGDVQLIVKLINIEELGHPRRKRLVVTAEDDTGTVKLVWFKGLKWIKTTLNIGQEYVIFGKPTFYESLKKTINFLFMS